MNREVFLSILAMDAYQRGYAPGVILGTNTDSIGTKIGRASISARSSSDLASSEVAAGFYGVSYTLDEAWAGLSLGTKIISYRGTDFDVGTDNKSITDTEFWDDLWNGWSTFLFPTSGLQTQFDFARQFFTAVSGHNFDDGAALGNFYVTGHSLGGGLAGFIDSRALVESYLVDPIPYGVTAWMSAIRDAWDATIDEFDGVTLEDLVGAIVPGYAGPLTQFALSFAENLNERRPVLSGIEGSFLEAEIASRILALQPAIAALVTGAGILGGAATSVLPVVGPVGLTVGGLLAGLGIYEQIAGVLNNLVENRDGLVQQDNYGAGDLLPAGPLEADRSTNLHSVPLHTIIKYGDTQWWQTDGGVLGYLGKLYWRDAAKYFTYGIFDHDAGVAPSLKIEIDGKWLNIKQGLTGDGTGLTAVGEQLARIIAYSAIDEGALVFGDTGIRALFNDADDLGRLMEFANDNPNLLPATFNEDMRKQFGRMIAEFAGFLAANKVTRAQRAEATQGILDYGNDPDQGAFRIDLRESTWTANGELHEAVSAEGLVEAFLNDPGTLANLGAIVDWYAHHAEGHGSGKLIEDIDEIVLSLQSGQLAEPRNPDGVTLQVGTRGIDNDTFGSGVDFVLGGEGDDILHGGGGSDILLGGDGADHLFGGSTSDRLQGGAGADELSGESGDDYLVVELDDAADTLDGGSGTDTVVYYFNLPADVLLTAPGSSPPGVNMRPFDFGITISAKASGTYTGFGDDQLTQIERAAVETGAADDDLALANNGVGIRTADIAYVNLGGGNDTINFSTWTNAGTVDLSKDRMIWSSFDPQGNRIEQSLTLRGAEHVFGGAGDDLLTAGARDNESYRLDGGGGNDVLTGGTSKTSQFELNGGNGNDHLSGGAGINTLRGDAGNDTLISGGKRTYMYGGAGSDTFHVGANTTIFDADASDKTFSGGVQLYGGVKQWWMEGGTAFWSPFSSVMNAFPVIGASILITAAFFTDASTMKFVAYQRDQNGNLLIHHAWGLGGITVLKGYHLDLDSGAGSGGISVFQQELTSNFSYESLNKYLNLALKAGFGVGLHGFDPLVLDLDGDGYELTTEGNSKAFFEFDTDGFAERTGWVRGDDALLARDANGNGTIDGITELFGNQTTSGFTMLAAHDGNADGVISASDAVYAELRVWQDADQDGVSDTGELKTLGEAGIVSISLASTAPGTATVVGGNRIVRTGTFTRANGTTGGVADVAFAISETATKWLGDSTVSASAALLPQLRGFGEVKDLRVAMTGDTALQGLVAGFVANQSTDLAVLKSGAEAILYAWAGVGGVAATALGTGGFDTRKLAFLEKYSGHLLMVRNGSGVIQLTNIAEMEELWTDQVNRLTLRLVVQGPMATEFAGISYRTDLDLLVADNATALGDLYHRLLADLPSSAAAALAQWQAWAPLLGVMADGMVRFDNNVVRDDYIAAQLLAAMDGVVQPLDFAALAGALGLDNLRIGTGADETLGRSEVSGTAIYLSSGGSDTINGGSGQDVYVFGHTIGNVVINDEEAKPAGDRIRFAFLTETDVTLSRSANDLFITVNATGETIKVTGQFAPVVPLSSDVLLSTDKGVEEIQFANGTIFEIPEIMTAVGTGTSGNDTMTGTMHSDVFLGGLGNDTLLGGDDADLYVFEVGDGHDTIRDIQTTPLLRAADMVIFGDNIAPQDLVLSRAGTSGQDLLITLGAGQSVLIEGQFGYTSLGYNDKLAPNSRIEAFGFRDYGESWSNKDVQQMLMAQATTANNDLTRGFGDDDIFAPSAGNDTMIGLDGNDTYYWGRGYGNDTIDEQALYIDIKVGLGGISLVDGADTVVFGPGIAPAQVTFSRASSAPHLTVTLDSGEMLTIRNQFDGFQTGVLGAQWHDRVEWFEFADGTRLSWQDVLLDVTTGSTGDDSLWGDLFQDTLTGGLGNDYLSGGGYADSYIFNAGDGQDIVNDNNQFILGSGFVSVDSTPDILRFGAGITSGGISFEFDSNNMTLRIGGGGDAVTLQGQNDYYNTGVFGAISNSRIERIEFANGEVWTWQDINARAIASKTTSGDDVIVGFDKSDRFEASAGNDIMRGGNSGDTYAFGIGSGLDRVEESIDDVFFGDDDAVEFGPGLTPSDITFVRNGHDLVIGIVGTTDQLTIAGEFNNYIGFTNNDIERFVFAGGTVITKGQVMASLTVGTPGNDVIEGFYINDTLVGGAGDDVLYGRDGSDRYVFNLGDGHDTINESVEFANLADNDRIVFGAGIAPSDIVLSRSENALTLTINGTSDSVTISGQYAFANGFTWSDIEYVEFANGTVWTKRDMANMLMGGTPGNDTIVGTFQNDDINGLAGNDILQGADGSDTYFFSRGDGQDTIQESVTNAIIADFDQVSFGETIARQDLTFVRNGDNLTIGIAGTTDTITVQGQFDNYIGYTNRDIEQIEFADGSVMSAAEIQAVLTTGTAGNDTILGFHTNDVLNGGGGDDTLQGLDGSDTYLFGRGSGHDTINESVEFVNLADNDRIQFAAGIAQSDVVFSRSGNDLIVTLAYTGDSVRIAGEFTWSGGFTWNDVESFEFSDGSSLSKQNVQDMLLTPTSGNDTITGFDSADVLRGAGGNDTLIGQGGNDSYFWARGDGSDTLTDGVDQGFDTLFLENVNPGAVSLTRNGNTMYVTIAVSSPGAGDGGTLTLVSSIDQNFNQGIDRIQFTDGTIWNRVNFQAILVGTAGTDGDDNITGTSGADVLAGGKGNDVIAGQNGDDTVVGGPGNDLVSGNIGDDTYVFNLGDGQDIIRENTTNVLTGGFDTLLFGEGILSTGITVTQTAGGWGLLLSINGTTDTILLDNDMDDDDYRIDQARFADGTILSHAQLLSLATAPTSGNDTFYGGFDANTLLGGGGNDTLDARGGNDTLAGGTGNDLLIGNIGNDTYVFNLGDGQDIIRDNTINVLTGGFDTLLFGMGIQSTGITVTQTAGGWGLLISVNGTTDTVLLDNDINDDDYRIDQAQFADGTILTHAQLMSLATTPTSGNDTFYGSYDGETLLGGAGNDTLDARSGNDTLTGGTGNDLLIGNIGNDTYVFNLGDGQDTIRDNTINVLTGGFDTLLFGAGILSTGITVTQTAGGWGLLISINGTSDTVLLDNDINDDDYRIDQAQFASGTILSHAQLMSLATTPTSGDDTFFGSYDGEALLGGAGNDTLDARSGNDTLTGGTGNDLLIGNLGNDTYVFNLGDGQDIIRDNTVNVLDGGNDTLLFGAGILSTGIKVTQSVGGGGLLISINGTADSVLIDNTINDTDYRIEQVQFANGAILTHAQLLTLALTPTSGDDLIYLGSGNDVIAGGAGNDTIDGGGGDDTFQFTGTGDGFDAITGGAGIDTIAAMANNTVIGLRSIATVEAVTAGGFTGVTISGTTTNDALNFSSVTLTGIARIDGGAGNDTITGPATATTFAGGSGDDTLIGGAGNDTFQVSGSGDGFDAITGGTGTDTIQAMANNTVIGLASLATVEAITAGSFTGVTISGSGVADTLNFTAVTLTGIARIDGGAGNDTITGPAMAATFAGGSGDDTLTGGAGNDNFQVTGTGDGFDAITGGTGTDTIQAMSNNTVIGLRSLTAIETITGGSFTGVTIAGTGANDTLNFTGVTLTGIARIDGGAGNDAITGPATAATFAGGAGDDALTGGAGNDTFQVTGSGDGFDAVTGGAGTDTIQAMANNTVIGLASLTTVEAITAGSFTGVTISGSAVADTLNFAGVTLTGIARIDGGAGNDTLTGPAAAATIAGGAGDDTITGGAGNDTFQFTGTGDGFDAITGGAGTDTITAMAGNTVIGLRSITTIEAITAGGFTGVTISGSAAADTLNFTGVTLTGIGRIDGGAGNDIITGSAGNDTLIGGAGTDTLNGAAGIDTVDYSYLTTGFTLNLALTTAQAVATGDSDTLSNIENITGGTGNDVLAGSTVDNVLQGGAGDDRLTGGAGNDTIAGGSGTNDIAVFAGLQASYSIVTNNGVVTVVDNQSTVDGNDGTDTINGIEKVEFKGGVQVGVTSPIILDLDGRGVETRSASRSNARFDMDGDGVRDQTSWIGSSEGFLFLDRDGNGTLSGVNEMSFTGDVPGAASDLVGLRAFDSNGDGLLSADDSAFAQFKVWQDTNGDGSVGGNEILTLADAGVASLNLTGTAVNANSALGDVATVHLGSYQRTDGSTMQFLDAVLTYHPGSIARVRSNRGGSILNRFGNRPIEAGTGNPADEGLASRDAGLLQRAAFDPLAFMRQAASGADFDSLADQLGGLDFEAIGPAQRVAIAAQTMELPGEMMAAVDLPRDGAMSDAGSIRDFESPDVSSARQLSLLRQDMAGFGAMGAMGQLEWRSGATYQGTGLAML